MIKGAYKDSFYKVNKELTEHEKFILSQMVNSDAKTIKEISLMYQKQLAEYINNNLNR